MLCCVVVTMVYTVPRWRSKDFRPGGSRNVCSVKRFSWGRITKQFVSSSILRTRASDEYGVSIVQACMIILPLAAAGAGGGGGGPAGASPAGDPADSEPVRL